MSPRYTTEKLLLDLKLKVKILGRYPTKREIDADKNMANSTTYFDRFGTLRRAIELIDSSYTPPCELSLELFKKYAREFYALNGRSPTVADFDKTKEFPHSTYIRDVCNMTWNEFLDYCGLPTYDYDEDLGAMKNRRVTLKIIEILKEKGYDVDDMRENTTSSDMTLIINQNLKILVKTSSPRQDKGNDYWKFHITAKGLIKPDMLILIGYEDAEYSDEGKVFVVPYDDVSDKQTISINVNRIDGSKYGKYYVGNIQDIEL